MFSISSHNRIVVLDSEPWREFQIGLALGDDGFRSLCAPATSEERSNFEFARTLSQDYFYPPTDLR